MKQASQLFLFLLVCAAPLFAQAAGTAPQTGLGATTSQIVTEARKAALSGTTANSLRPFPATPSQAIWTAYEQAEIARYNEVSYRADHVRWVYDSQYWSSWIILLVVVAIVSAGISFSIIQLRMAQAAAQKNIQAAQELGGTVKFSP